MMHFNANEMSLAFVAFFTFLSNETYNMVFAHDTFAPSAVVDILHRTPHPTSAQNRVAH